VLFLVSLGQNSAITHLSAMLTDRGASPSLASMAVSLLGAATLAGRLGTGWLLDHYFAARVSFGLLIVSAAGILLLAYGSSLPVALLAVVMIGIGLGGEADVTPYLLSRYFGLRSITALYGFTWTAYAVAGAIGPVLMGRSFDSTASYSGLLIKLAFLTLTAANTPFSRCSFFVQFALVLSEPLPVRSWIAYRCILSAMLCIIYNEIPLLVLNTPSKKGEKRSR